MKNEKQISEKEARKMWLIPSVYADLIKVSRQRILQMIYEGKLEVGIICGKRHVRGIQ